MIFPHKRFVYILATIMLGTLLFGCSKEGGYATPRTAQATCNAAQVVTDAPTDLKITAWGPQRTSAGVIFNAQPDGNAALWVQVNQSLDGSDSVITMDGTVLQSAISGKLITAFVPPRFYAKAGVHALHVTMKKGVVFVQSNDVKFVVQ